MSPKVRYKLLYTLQGSKNIWLSYFEKPYWSTYKSACFGGLFLWK